MEEGWKPVQPQTAAVSPQGHGNCAEQAMGIMLAWMGYILGKKNVEILTIEHFQLSGLIETYLSSCMHTLSIYKHNQLRNYYHTFVFFFGWRHLNRFWCWLKYFWLKLLTNKKNENKVSKIQWSFL